MPAADTQLAARPDAKPAARLKTATPTVAIVGATGAVGVELMRVLEQRRFPLAGLKLLASPRSAGKTLDFQGHSLTVEAIGPRSFDGVDVALFSAGASTSREWAPVAVQAGAVVVDNSSAFRMDPSVPLVVPEINAAAMAGHAGIIANPNCVAIIQCMALWPVHRRNPVRRLIVSTYQSASGAGAAAMQELHDATAAYVEGRDFTPRVLPHPYAFNLFSHNTKIDPATGYNDEETKVMHETRKIVGDAGMRITTTCIRVPVLRAHSIAMNLECEDPISPAMVRALLDGAPGIRLVDDPARNHFPMPNEASGQDDVLVGRIRQDLSDPSGRSIAMFVAGDQLLKGAALNAVQIAERLLG